MPLTFHSNRGCHAQGLVRGDCPHPAEVNGLYCYYHEKVARGLVEPEIQQSYPVYPLPTFAWKLRIHEVAAA